MLAVSILYASGQKTTHLAIREFLTIQGHFLYCPEDVAGLVMMIKLHPPVDFIIFATDLEGLTNFHPLEQIRELYPITPILLLMTMVTIEALLMARLARCNEVIQEPVEPVQMERLISKYLSEKVPDSTKKDK
jgi:CheY-like chemotaxis protein